MPQHLTQGKVLAAMHKGAVITLEYAGYPATTGTKIYRLSSNNRHIPKALMNELIKNKLIVPNGDGLPGVGESQTYRIARNLEE